MAFDSAARPQSIRVMNEQLLLDLIRRASLPNPAISRADLARASGLSKPTVSLALTNMERAGLVFATGVRSGVPGPAAVLYQVRAEAGMVLALDVGQQFCAGRSVIWPAPCGPGRRYGCTRPAAREAKESSPSSSASGRPCCGWPASTVRR